MSAGTILGGKYRLISLVGRGGMGSVWRAERLGWHSPVAIKLMNAPIGHDTAALGRFQREARLAATLRSVHVVQVLDDGVDESTGAPFIVMELLEGETLAERLRRIGRLRPENVALVVTQIARALGRAHEIGLIHRDLKPDNILLVRNDDEEIVKVLDFGIAKWIAAPQADDSTLAGHVVGTPSYMSPEQLMSSRSIDHRADLWSLGIIACECMTGTRPFEAPNLVSLAFRICSGQAPLASSFGPVPEGFDAWLARSLSKDPERRFPSARVMAEELRGLCGHLPMFWRPEAARSAPHASVAKTELEPVLELRRKVDRSAHKALPAPLWPVTELSSVAPTERGASQPPESRALRALPWGLVALVLVASGAWVSPWRLSDVGARVEALTRDLQERVTNARSARLGADGAVGATRSSLDSSSGTATPLEPPPEEAEPATADLTVPVAVPGAADAGAPAPERTERPAARRPGAGR